MSSNVQCTRAVKKNGGGWGLGVGGSKCQE